MERPSRGSRWGPSVSGRIWTPQFLQGNSVTYKSACATDVTDKLLEWSLKGGEQIYRAGYRYKKAGVMLNHLVPAGQISRRLFHNANFERSRRLMKAVDEINNRRGRKTVRFGVAWLDGRWKTKFLRRSPKHTTRLPEVLRMDRDS